MKKPSEKEQKLRLKQLQLWLMKINSELDEEHQLEKINGDYNEWNLVLSAGHWILHDAPIEDQRPFIGVIRWDDNMDYLKLIILAAKQYRVNYQG